MTEELSVKCVCVQSSGYDLSLQACQATFHSLIEIVPSSLSLHKQMEYSELPAFGSTQLASFYEEK